MKNNIIQNPNLAMLEFVVRKLGELKDEFVFVGGCTTALLVTESVLGIRQTKDVDCIVDVLTLNEYYHLEKRLKEKGFKKSLKESVICRWYYDDIILDVMPTDEKILSFGNSWYKPSIQNAIVYEITEYLFIRVITAPYFLATKLEAFHDRGKNDFLGSHDLEDIITVIDGRSEIVGEIAMVERDLKMYLAQKFSDFLSNDDFRLALAGHLNHYRSLTEKRVTIVLDRLEKIARL